MQTPEKSGCLLLPFEMGVWLQWRESSRSLRGLTVLGLKDSGSGLGMISFLEPGDSDGLFLVWRQGTPQTSAWPSPRPLPPWLSTCWGVRWVSSPSPLAFVSCTDAGSLRLKLRGGRETEIWQQMWARSVVKPQGWNQNVCPGIFLA